MDADLFNQVGVTKNGKTLKDVIARSTAPTQIESTLSSLTDSRTPKAVWEQRNAESLERQRKARSRVNGEPQDNVGNRPIIDNGVDKSKKNPFGFDPNAVGGAGTGETFVGVINENGVLKTATISGEIGGAI